MDEPVLGRRALRAITDLLDRRPGRRPTVAEVASALILSETKLRRSLHRLRAATPKALITRSCLEYAAHLIQRRTKIGAALAAAGFRQKTNFNRQFRQHFGCLPCEYRERHRLSPD